MDATDVVVVGAGVIGSATAYYLTRAGIQTTLIDRHRPIISGSASQASAGGVRHQGRVAPEIPLALHSIQIWTSLEDELGAHLHYRQDGMTIVIDDEALLPKLHARVKREQELGLDIRVVEGPELHEMIPGLPPQIVAGSYCPLDGHADPMLTTSALAAAAQRQGARVEWECAVERILVRGDRVIGVRTPRGDIACQHVILAAGAWTAPIAATVGVDLPIRPGVIQMMVTAPRPHVLDQVLSWFGHSISLKQAPIGAFVIGGGWPGWGDPATYQTGLQPGSMAKSARTTLDLFPSLAGVPIVRAWVGIEAFCVDDQPIIGPIQGVEGLTVAAGFSGHGFALSPGVGSLLAEHVVTGHLSPLLHPFSHTRFSYDQGKIPA